MRDVVVSYRNSTSNHNYINPLDWQYLVVSYRNSTSNHNYIRNLHLLILLYLIEILHQTTTGEGYGFLIDSCILSKFYIKPQLRLERELARCVVSYRNSTSNHNCRCLQPGNSPLYLIEILHQTTTIADSLLFCYRLYLIEILHQTTTWVRLWGQRLSLYLIEILHQTTTLRRQRNDWFGCILSKFYIKPQLLARAVVVIVVVSYRNSTSNHNGNVPLYSYWVLYLIEILHQTTTVPYIVVRDTTLYLIEILHQTTTSLLSFTSTEGCILSKFYIKPQLGR